MNKEKEKERQSNSKNVYNTLYDFVYTLQNYWLICSKIQEKDDMQKPTEILIIYVWLILPFIVL
jgi:hypothetical protein